MEKDIIKAKELFSRFGGSKFHMTREGVIDEYEKHQIPEKVEIIWINEMIEEYFSQFDILNFDTLFPLSYAIEHHLKIEYFDRFIELIRVNIYKQENQYYITLYAERLFSLIERFAEFKTELSRELKIKGLNYAEEINKIAKKSSIPFDFKIENFDVSGNGLTQEQYVLRRIYDLEYKIKLVRILQ